VTPVCVQRGAADPCRWSCEHVRLWLQWAVQNFSFEGVDASQFDGCSGADLLDQGRDRLLQRAPLYVGDILWEHLDILQKGEPHARTNESALVSSGASIPIQTGRNLHPPKNRGGEKSVSVFFTISFSMRYTFSGKLLHFA